MSTIVAPVRRPRSQTKLVFFVVFGFLTVFVTYMKNAHVFDPSSQIAQHFAPVKWYLIPHALFGGLAMLLARFSFHTGCARVISRCIGCSAISMSRAYSSQRHSAFPWLRGLTI